MQCRVIGIWGGFPKKDGPCSGFLIQQDDFSLLIDCGCGVVQQLQHYSDLNEINHVVLSHYHYEPCSDVGLYEGMDGAASGHMTSEEVGILAEKSGSKRILLTHLPHYGDLDELVKSARRQGNSNIRLAEVGMVVGV